MNAGQIFWVDWQDTIVEGGITKYRGKITVTRPDSTVVVVTVKFSGPRGVAFFQSSGGTDYWTNGVFSGTRNPATSPYTSAVVDNIPTGTDIIGLQFAQVNTLEFTNSAGGTIQVGNPVFAYVSLNGNGYGFDQDFNILSFGDASDGNDPGYWGAGTSFKNVTTVGGVTEYQLLGTGEPHGTLQFKGGFSTVHWRSLSDEYWNGFTIGVPSLAVDTPGIPIANAGPDQTVNAAANCQATVQLSGSVTGSTNTPFTYSWTGSFGTVTGQAPTVTLPLGQSTITLTVTDSVGSKSTDTVVITVVDVTPPTLSLNPVNGVLANLGTVKTLFTSVAGSPTGGLAHAHGIAYDLAHNTVWVTDTELGNDIFEFPATQPHGSTVAPLTRLNPPISTNGTIEGVYYNPSDQTLWYIEFNGTIHHIDRSGATLPGGFSVAADVPAGTFGAHGLGIAIQGNFVWVDNGRRAYKFNQSGSFTGFSFPLTLPDEPCLTYDPERNLIWTSHWIDKRFRAYNPNTGALVFTSAVINPLLADRRGHLLSIGAGKIWVATEEVIPGQNNGSAEVIYGIDIIGGAIDKIVECGTPFNDPGASATDSCGTATVVRTGSVNTASVGTYVLTYTAVDLAGNPSAPQTRTITVIDTTPPVITCPPSQVVSTDPGLCTARVTFAATATDSCGGVTFKYMASGATIGEVTSGAAFNKGLTSITCTATDSHNNTAACSFTITVNDNEAPAIAVPAPLVVAADPGKCSAVVNFSVVATDNCPGVSVITSPASGFEFPTGTTTVTSVATDAANHVTTRTFTVTVEDRQPPTIACPRDIFLNAAPGTCSAVASFSATPSDNCPGVVVSYSHAPGSLFNVGTTVVTATAKDAAGLMATCTFNVVVLDVEPPILARGASNQTVECDGAGNVTALQQWLTSHGGATASDACNTVTWSNNFTTLTKSCGGAGSATVVFTASDGSGNTVTTSGTFTIVDTTAPSLIRPASDAVIECNIANNAAAIATWLAGNGGAVARDACGGVTWTHNFTALTGGCGATGTAVVTFTATDDCGNSTTTIANLAVVDRTPPQITQQAANSTVECDGAGNVAALNAWLANNGGAVAVDSCSAVAWSHNYSSLSDGPGATGAATVTFTAADGCGNVSTTVATFSIVDKTPPVITTPAANQTVECDGSGNTAALAAWLAANGGAAARDTCGAVTWSNNFTSLSDGPGASGSATVVFTATDESGKSSPTSATFSVNDTAPPSITTPAAPKTVECDGAGNTAALEAWLTSNGGAVASDTCGRVSWRNNFDGLTAGCGATGAATVTFAATDESGNTSTTVATFTIVDTTAPAIGTQASNKTVECDGAGNTAALAAWLTNNGDAVALDACGRVTWSNNFQGLSDGCGATGSATVIFTATDACGNKSTTTATFTIVDSTPPTIVASAANKTVETDGAGNTADLSAWLAANGGAVATDGCGTVKWTNNYTATTLIKACGSTGAAAVTFTATDECGNTSSTTATFTIIDTTKPVLASNVHDITPSDKPETFTITSTDIGGSSTPTITNVTATRLNGSGKPLDKTEPYKHTVSGNQVTIESSGGIDTVWTIYASSVDECGNTETAQFTITVVKKK